MSKKRVKKTNLTRLIINIILLVVGIASIILSIFGLVNLSNLDLVLEKENLRCDNKDYSSYVKVNVTETPGNEKINAEIERYERAMDRAREAGDYNSYGQLNERYQQLLYAQSQTSTSEEEYDYSEAEKAKKNCYSLASTHKKSEQTKSIWMVGVGLIILTICAVIGIVYNKKCKTSKKH